MKDVTASAEPDADRVPPQPPTIAGSRRAAAVASSNEHEARVVVHGGEPADARIMRICFVPPPAYDSAMRAAPPILDFPSILDLVSPLVRYLECVGP